MEPGDTNSRRTLSHQTAMVVPDPPRPSRSLREVTGNGQLPNALTKILASCFCMVRKDGEGLSMDNRAGLGIHSFLSHLASGVDPVPGLDQLELLGVYQDGMLHLLHSLFSIPVDLYSSTRHIFACRGEQPNEVLPLMLELLV